MTALVRLRCLHLYDSLLPPSLVNVANGIKALYSVTSVIATALMLHFFIICQVGNASGCLQRAWPHRALEIDLLEGL
jgi:hypothetical protein